MKSLKEFITESANNIEKAVENLSKDNNGISSLVDDAANIVYKWYENENDLDRPTRYYESDLADMFDAASGGYDYLVVGLACGFISVSDIAAEWGYDECKSCFDYKRDDVIRLARTNKEFAKAINYK